MAAGAKKQAKKIDGNSLFVNKRLKHHSHYPSICASKY
jgi:hypothetical protein